MASDVLLNLTQTPEFFLFWPFFFPLSEYVLEYLLLKIPFQCTVEDVLELVHSHF